jgi:SAM-dependent methyltransferase
VVYDALAPIYDRIMNHVSYDEWFRLIGRVIEKFLPVENPAILELGGGTGALAELLIERGYRYRGSDRCPSMCRAARRRGVRFFCADGRSIPVKGRFDLVLFLYDGINYLPSLDDYTRLFNEVWSVLSPGGIFLFDITTEANSLHHFRNYLEFEDWGDYSYTRRSYYNKDTMRQHNDFTIFRRVAPESPLYEKHIENHSQCVFGASSIARAVPTPLFCIEGIWDGYSFRQFRPHSERIHFLLKKRGA